MNRVVFLDIDGPIIPFSMYLVNRMASHHRIIPKIPIAVVNELCKRGNAKVVFNTTHNNNWDGVPDIDVACVRAGLSPENIHHDTKTRYPQISRDQAVIDWLKKHPETTDWVAFDDAKFIEDERLVWVDPDAGLHLGHLNQVLDRWNIPQFLVL